MTISISLIGGALGVFAIMFVFQILLQRIYRPASEDKFIIAVFAILPFFGFIGLLSVRFFGFIPIETGILGYMLFFVISSSWVASYPAVYAVCPTLIMAYVIDRNYKDGRGTSARELRDLLGLKQNSDDRIQDAIHNRWIVMKGSEVQLTWFGQTALCCFRTYRRLLGLNLETL